MRNSEIDKELHAALTAMDGARVLRLSDDLIALRDEDLEFSAYFIRGMAFEIGGGGLDTDLARAEMCFRRTTTLSEDCYPLLHLVRVLLKQGEPKRNQVLRYIDQARLIEQVPEVHLAYGMYYEASGAELERRQALKHYRRAIFAGRYRGYYGCARVYEKEGKPLIAASFYLMRLFFGPLHYLIHGRRAGSDL